MLMANEANEAGEPAHRIPTIGLSGVRRQYAWAPQPDITVQELAFGMVILHMAPLVRFGAIPPAAIDQAYDEMPPEVQRHFLTKEASSLVLPRGRG